MLRKGSDPAVHQAASQNYDKAMDAGRQIARGFNAVGVGSLDATVDRLLEEPIRFTDRFIIKDPDKAGAGKVNGELRAFCNSQRNTLRKYPFQSASTEDASLEEFGAIFQSRVRGPSGSSSSNLWRSLWSRKALCGSPRIPPRSHR